MFTSTEESPEDMLHHLTFSTALEFIKQDNKIARAGWNGKGMWLELQRPDEHSKMTLPYIYMKTADDNLVPWLASQTDILAEDWQVLGGLSTVNFPDV